MPRTVPADRRRRAGDRPLRVRIPFAPNCFRAWPTAATVGALGLSGSVVVGSDLVVTGESPAVLGAPDADVLVLVAGDDVVVVDAAADGVTVTALDVAGHHPQRRLGGAARRDGAPRTGCCAARRARARTVFRILAVRRGGRRQLGQPGDGRRVRQGARAVRPDDRHLPGGQAPRRQHARRRRADHRGHLGCRPRRRSGQRMVRRRGRRVARHPHAGFQRAEQHSAARRYRVHLGARRTPLPAPGPHAGGADGRRRRPTARRRRGRSAAVRRTARRSRCRPRPRSTAQQAREAVDAGAGAARRQAARLPRRLRLPGAALAEAVGPRGRRARAVGHRGGVRRRRARPTWASPAG